MMRAFRTLHAIAAPSVPNFFSVFIVVWALSFDTAAPFANAQDFEAFEPPGLVPPAGAMSALAQAGQPDFQFGFQLFHLLLEQKGLYSVSDFAKPMEQRPRQTSVVLVGKMGNLPAGLRAQLQEFVGRGGTLLVATDESAFFSDLFLVRQGPFEVRTDKDAYQGYRDCPVVTDLPSRSHIMDGVSRIIANRSGAIAQMNNRLGNWQTLARLPDVEAGSLGRRAELPLIAQMQSRYRQGGRLLLMADHSILINGMLWHGDNAKLAVNLADWLSAGGQKEVVFIVDGQPIKAMLATPPEFPDELPPLEDLPTPTLKDLSRLPKDVLLKFANRFVAGLEDADVMNELLANQPAELPTPRYRQMLYIGGGMLATICILRLMGRTGHRVPSSPPRALGEFADSIRLPALSAGEAQSAGRELAQNALRQLTGSSDPLDWAIPVKDIEIDAGFLRRVSVRDSLKRLKRQASNTDRTLTSPRDLKRLAGQIAVILGLKNEGRLRHPSIPT